MRTTWKMACGTVAVVGLCLAGVPAAWGHGYWSVGVNFGPAYYRPYYPCYRPYYYPYYYARPVVVLGAPPPVVVQPAPVVQAVPVAQPVYQAASPPPATQAPATAPPAAPETLPPPSVAPAVSGPRQADVDHFVQQLAATDEQARADAAIQLGRMRAYQAIDPLAATLAGDQSPTVRESAARALGLIGSPKALPALRRAAHADSDREVRHSAQFAVDVVQTSR